MKREVPGAAAGGCFSEGGIVGRQSSFRSIELIDQQFVESEIGRDGKAIVGRDVDGVSMRAGLALLVDARSFVLDGRRSFVERSILVDWQRSDAAAAVVGDKCHFAGFIN